MNSCKSFILLFIFLFSVKLHASDDKKISVTPIGRILLDVGEYINGPDTLCGGAHFSDIRIGLKGKFDDNYYFKIDIGFLNGKVSAKDVFVGYIVEGHSVQIGQFYEPFSMDMLCSTSDMHFHQVAGATSAFSDSRKIGILYTYDRKRYNLSFGLFSNASFAKEQRDFKAFSFAGRFVYRFLHTPDEVFTLGISPLWGKTGKELSQSSVGISSWEDVSVSRVSISDACSRFRVGGELLYLNPRISFMAEYMYSNIKRAASKSYRAMGGYGQFSWIVSGAQYVYDDASSCLSRPSSRSLEWW